MGTGLARFGRPQALVCNLGTSGTLATHTPGQAYSSSFNVTNRVGQVTAELVSATPALPAGWSLQVNQATGVVTLAWPAATAGGALPNLGFETGTADWVLGNGWTIDSTGLVESGTQSAKYRGIGQAAMLHSQLVPVTPGTTITATARISTGITREDFAGAEPGLLWHDANGVPISFSAAINDPRPRGPAFQTVIAQGVAPPGAAFVRLFVSGFRDLKGRARDSVYVDTVTWTHTYALGGGQATNYAVVIRVRDGRGCQATLSQTIAQLRTYSYWSPTNKFAGITLPAATPPSSLAQNQSGTQPANIHSVIGKTSGRWYVEAVVDNYINSMGFGFARSTNPFNVQLGFTNGDGWAYVSTANNPTGGVIRANSGNAVTGISGFGAGSVIGLYLDLDNGRAWWARNSATPLNGGNPTTGTSPMITFTPGGLIYHLAADCTPNLARWRLRTNPSELTYTPVAGFTAGWPD